MANKQNTNPNQQNYQSNVKQSSTNPNPNQQPTTFDKDKKGGKGGKGDNCGGKC